MVPRILLLTSLVTAPSVGCTAHEGARVEPPPVIERSMSPRLDMNASPPSVWWSAPRSPEQERQREVERYDAGVAAVLLYAVREEALHGRRVTYSRMTDEPLEWIDRASMLACAGRACDDSCIGELDLATSGCGTGHGRGPDTIDVTVEGCAPDRHYSKQVDYDPIRLSDAPALVEVAVAPDTVE
ncbi:MAG: hypothetical protein AB1Z98_23990 [Nannocystaceae bacterium]